MLDRFTQRLDRNKLCGKDKRVLLAVSGGLDSMIMLDLFHKAGFKIGVAHCNFQLREEESEGDETFVNNSCKAIGVECFTNHFDTKNYAAKNGLSTQMAARKLRYLWFDELVKGKAYDMVATAHHADDNLETTLMHLVRGTGMSGIKGIPMVSGHIIRPLLSFTKSELEAYADANNLKWREDKSNAASDYDRNYIRHQVIPNLQTLNPSLNSTFIRTNERLYAAGELFDLGLELVKKRFVNEVANQVTIDKEIRTAFQQPAAVLWEIIKIYGFNYDQCLNIIDAIDGPSGTRFFAVNYQITIDRDSLILEEQKDLQSQTIIQIGDNRAVLDSSVLEIESVGKTPISEEDHVAHLDGDRLKYPLLWRRWHEGDFFYPLGMKGKKKLSNFFIDNKVSRPDKDKATVLVSGEDIVWVVGYRIDDRYKISASTKQQACFIFKSDI